MNETDTATATRATLPRIAFLDHIRTLMVLLVVVYHSVAAYATVAPHWVIHDTTFFVADIVRELFDLFVMPVLFFVAGYFALPSLEKRGVWEFLKGKGRQLLIPWALAVLVFIPLPMYSRAEGLSSRSGATGCGTWAVSRPGSDSPRRHKGRRLRRSTGSSHCCSRSLCCWRSSMR